MSEQKHSSGEENPVEDRLSEHRIGGWRAVSAAGLHGRGSHKRNVFFTDTGIKSKEQRECKQNTSLVKCLVEVRRVCITFHVFVWRFLVLHFPKHPAQVISSYYYSVNWAYEWRQVRRNKIMS